MGFDIKVRSEAFTGNEDRSWLGSQIDNQWMPRSITLDVSAFLPAHVNVKGAIPSGCVLAKITATGLYGPYTPGGAGGLEVAAGLLFSNCKVGDGTGADLATAADVGVAMFWAGIVRENKLPAFAGTALGEIDADGKTALGNFIRFE
jgi:hypothetical protein